MGTGVHREFNLGGGGDNNTEGDTYILSSGNFYTVVLKPLCACGSTVASTTCNCHGLGETSQVQVWMCNKPRCSPASFPDSVRREPGIEARCPLCERVTEVWLQPEVSSVPGADLSR